MREKTAARDSSSVTVMPQPAANPAGEGDRLSDRMFVGPGSLRVRGERAALWGCSLAAPLTLAVIGLFLESVTFSGFVLLVVAGMVFVSVGRGRLLGSSIRIHGRQMPEIEALVGEIAARLDIEPPQVFVRDDPFQAITALGIGEPYALVLSSQYIDHLRREELAFLVARELGHIAAGHTRIASLLSASGRENPIVALVFGAWLRRTEYTADRVGLLCCGGLTAALGAIAIASFHAVGRRIDMNVLAEQRRELDAEPSLRMGEWIAAIPYATNRLDALRAFDASPLAATWRATLDAPPTAARRAHAESLRLAPRVGGTSFPGAASAGTASRDIAVASRDCADFWRRGMAFFIDLIVITAILKTSAVVALKENTTGVSLHNAPPIIRTMLQHLPLVQVGSGMLLMLCVYLLYSTLLVGVAGQTLGMMIFELRVVTTRFARPSLLQCAWRYTAAFASALTTAALFCCFFRVHPHDRLSGTRVVHGRRA